MADFTSTFQQVEDALRSAAGNVMGKIDQMTFRMLVNNLKSTDYQVVVDTLEQIESEKRPISIPPVFFLSKSHPDQRIRDRAAKVLSIIDPDAESVKLTAGVSAEDAVRKLILHYGNFRA